MRIRPPVGRELDRVGEQVPDHLLQAVRVAGDAAAGGERGLDVDVLGRCRRPQRVEGLLDHPFQLDRVDGETELAHHDA